MFVDASSIVAILTDEPEAEAVIGHLECAVIAITSAIAIFEATPGLLRKYHATGEEAETDVREFVATARVTIVPVGPNEATTALRAFGRYGKGRGHPAQLHMGDCFAYAVGKNHRTSLLYKGNDFSKTNIEAA